MYNSYFAEYCIRRKFIDTAADNYLETLRLIGCVYKPPDELLSQPAAAVAQPQAVADDSTGTTSVASRSSCNQPSTTFSRAADIANFDLGFQIDDDDDLDSSADFLINSNNRYNSTYRHFVHVGVK